MKFTLWTTTRFRWLIGIGVVLFCIMVYVRQHTLTVLRCEDCDLSLTQSRAIDRSTPYLIPNDDILNELSELELWRIYWSSNFQFDFDETAHKYLGCDVYTYDPTQDPTGKTIPNGIKFFKVGLAGKDFTTDNGWEMKTLQSIFKDNNHEHKTIDIIKIDIQGSEWDSLPNIFETGMNRQIKQILIEVHLGHMLSDAKKPYWGNVGVAKQLRVLRLLYEQGFRIFMRDRNMSNLLKMDAPPQETISPQSEISLINMAFSHR